MKTSQGIPGRPGPGGPRFDAGLLDRREDVVIEHTIATVTRQPGAAAPSALLGSGLSRVVPFEKQPLTCDETVRHYFDSMLAAFPDLEHEVFSVHHTTDAVLLEARINGTQSADWRDIPNRGKRMELPVAVLCHFDGDLLLDEALYYDHADALRQLS
ncbi:ester cyclase [Streptomyces goshikiensis]|uniref:ester cyclase n=1 Tax=Streptomyces goshikiensis TaxID=1942 RepID=UPI0036C5C2F7